LQCRDEEIQVLKETIDKIKTECVSHDQHESEFPSEKEVCQHLEENLKEVTEKANSIISKKVEKIKMLKK
jgi:hypothetical protein